MPELPEVETLANQLKQKLTKRKVHEVEIFQPDILKCSPEILQKALSGDRVQNCYRRGKYLAVEMTRPWILWFHLGMTGRLLWQENLEDDGHRHLRISFEGETSQLFFRDPRRFGKILLTGKSPEAFPSGVKRLGEEPLGLPRESFVGLYKIRKGRIKNLLLNQSLVAGIGNIYADESLFRAGIHPRKRPFQLSRSILGRLHEAVCETLQEAIEAGGSSIDDYRHTDGMLGHFQERHQVYGREGQACTHCRQPIKRIVLGGRSSFFCSRCQR